MVMRIYKWLIIKLINIQIVSQMTYIVQIMCSHDIVIQKEY
jgi:hypothetical protein